MDEKWFSVEQAADMLRLHPKTMRRYITEGKLRANKVGKQYRISGHDLSLFIEGRDAELELSEQFVPSIDVSAVVDVSVRGRDEADKIESMLIAALNSKDPSYGTSSANVQRSAGGSKVRVMLWGTPRFISAILECITAISGNNDNFC